MFQELSKSRFYADHLPLPRCLASPDKMQYPSVREVEEVLNGINSLILSTNVEVNEYLRMTLFF